jgi:hypothetical protein
MILDTADCVERVVHKSETKHSTPSQIRVIYFGECSEYLRVINPQTTRT